MKYIKRITFFLIALFIFIPISRAKENVNIYLFYSEF